METVTRVHNLQQYNSVLSSSAWEIRLLSYRHSFHAGNVADVLKHIVLIEILQHLLKKDKAFSYIDTHAGAGLYHLKSQQAEKLQEYQQGIARLIALDWPELAAYQAAVRAVNPDDSLTFYPGSPRIALHYLRPQDPAWLFELHPEDVELLSRNVHRQRQAKVWQEDGLKGVLRMLPPASRRGLVLIDPSYEIKTDYDAVFNTVVAACKKFATGIYAIWYPVVDRTRIDRLEQQFRQSGIKHIQLFELGLSPDSDARGMTSSGMIVINPPWPLRDAMSALLPKLVSALDDSGEAFYRNEVLVPQ